MQRNLEKQKDKIVTKQVVGGKEFKGKAFNSKPEIIHFKVSIHGQVAAARTRSTKVRGASRVLVHMSECLSFLWQDFDVGKTYKKRVTLTNVSYTVNHLKLIGVTDQLKDFVDIQ